VDKLATFLFALSILEYLKPLLIYDGGKVWNSIFTYAKDVAIFTLIK
jgi:hypothetical protein